MELPPETFEFFLAHDIRTHSTPPLCPFLTNLAIGAKVGHVINPTTPMHEIVFSIAQADKNFKVREVGHVRIGNVRDGSGKVVENKWTPLPVAKQGRASESDPWVVTCDWPKLPDVIVSAAAGKLFNVTVQSEILELDRLGLEEPLQLTQDIIIQVGDAKTAACVALTEDEVKTRFRHTTLVQEIYMGQFEVSDAAVNAAMMSLRDQSSEGSKDVIKELEDNIDRLKSVMIEECARQFEDLALRTAQLGLDIKQNLELWQLPSELVGAVSGGSNDAEGLKKELAGLKLQLKAAHERISYLESGYGTSRATQQIAMLRKAMVEKKKNGNAVDDTRGSKVCLIS